MREFTVPRVFLPIPPIKSSLHITHRVIDLDPRERTYPTNSNYFSTITRLCRFMSQAILAWGINKVTASQGSALFQHAFSSNGAVIMKFGQFLSTRQDILPHEIIKRLNALQDSVEHHTTITDPLKIFQNETGVALNQESLQGRIGAGCIAEVFKLKINDKYYALKIINPTVYANIHKETRIMALMARIFNVTRFYNEFQDNLLKQFDLRNEFQNTIQFRRNFKDFQVPTKLPFGISKVATLLRGISYIFPKPIIATDKILLTEYHEGDRVRQGSPLIGKSALILFMKMVFTDGFVHSDLHPGNLSIIHGLQDGSLTSKLFKNHKTVIIYDSGLAQSFTKTQVKNLKDLIKELLLKNKNSAISLIINRNKMNNLTENEKKIFIRKTLKLWNNFETNNFDLKSALNTLFNIFVLSGSKVYLDASYTNAVLSSIYVKSLVTNFGRINSAVAMSSGCMLDYMDILIRGWLKQQNL
ncbi:uncharacterized protein NESG_01797 [Nematocida ausubeli]|uniref:Protein kinase domain-containing protein n=1 Tax=Nematocida ausubeli (strain ATCC PRA-371 / ERTm2) TaxID=1913371 RepID=A0A086J0Z3_NEMA1|nr:uncharacterized protein NESG_01797 [Nematocida ausubeli]KFG25811.1 hypothetical protein NESG_01797 [Nematocida ausubeli]